MPYEQLLFDRPFQGQYVKFKKLKEWQDAGTEENLFGFEGDGGKAIWIKALKEEGVFDRKNSGEFFDPIPRYCVNTKLDCRSGKFEPNDHRFEGDVKVMLNQNCILACSSFVADLAANLGRNVRFYGIPDSGDPAAIQIAINLYLAPNTPKGFEIRSQVWNSGAPPIVKDLLLTQTVSFTEATDAEGNPESGVARTIKKMPPLSYKNYPTQYPGDVLKLVLKQVDYAPK